MLSYEYIQFLDQKILEFLPRNFVRVGDKLNGRCPICGDSKKSSRKRRGWVYLKNASYYCFNCGTGLSGIKFLEYISGSSYEDIRKEYTRLFLKSGMNLSLSSYYEKPTSEPTLFGVQSIINPEWKNPLSKDALEYLENRKILEAPFYDRSLYSCYSKDKSKEFILIPWIVNGTEAYYQINDFKKYGSIKYIFPKGKQKLLAGLDNVDLSWPYIICTEGYYDSLFVKNGVCVGTKAITDLQEKLIRERYPHHQIVVSFDNDEAGLSSMARILRQNKNFKFFRWFNKNTKEKDINDYVLAKGNVNIFADSRTLEKMIVDKLLMKMFLISANAWNNKAPVSC